jgi:DNA polymerase elongation subunit (family B)
VKASYRAIKPRILDFDMESVAAGFADPQWVPQKITAIAWSWVGSDTVDSIVGTPESLYTKPEIRVEMIRTFLEVLDEADMVTGHNLLRHDLPVLNAELMRLRFPSTLRPIKVHDTMKMVRAKGFKKGQDNIAALVETHERKIAMDWQQWEAAYAEPGWPKVRKRCVSDVITHKEMLAEMKELGWLKKPTWWRP